MRLKYKNILSLFILIFFGYVFKFPEIEWEKQGCFKEVKSKKEKAMAKNYATFRKYKKNITGAVEACMKAAEKQKLTIFATCTTVIDD